MYKPRSVILLIREIIKYVENVMKHFMKNNLTTNQRMHSLPKRILFWANFLRKITKIKFFD
jgi:hypothetical protein